MSATNRGPGRPPKQSPEVAQKGREYLELHTKLDVPVEKIAQRDNLSATWVHELIKRARAEEAAERAANTAPSPPDEPKQARPLRRLSRRIAQSRAWDIADRRPNFALGLGANSLWVRTIVAIHEEGDGFRLHIGEEGARFRSRDDLAVLLLGHLDRQEVDVKGWLKALFEHGRLIDVDDVDIGIPRGLGLIPGENSRGEPLKAAPVKKQESVQAPLPFRPMVVSGGRSDSSEIPPSDSSEMPISLESDSSEIPNFDSSETRISLESDEIARAAAAAAYAQEDQSLNSSSSIGSPAGATQVKFGISLESDSSEIPPCDSSEIKSQRSAVGVLADQLMTLAGIIRPAKPDEVGAVERWTTKGFRTDAIQGVIEAKMKERDGKPPRTLLYFDELMHEALGPKSPASVIALPQSPAPITQPATPDPIDDPAAAIGDGTEPQWVRVRRGLRTEVGQTDYKFWLSKMALIGIDDDCEVTVTLPSPFLRDTVRSRFGSSLTAHWQAQNPDIRRVNVELAERREAAD